MIQEEWKVLFNDTPLLLAQLTFTAPLRPITDQITLKIFMSSEPVLLGKQTNNYLGTLRGNPCEMEFSNFLLQSQNLHRLSAWHTFQLFKSFILMETIRSNSIHQFRFPSLLMPCLPHFFLGAELLLASYYPLERNLSRSLLNVLWHLGSILTSSYIANFSRQFLCLNV